MYRSHNCGELRISNLEQVSLSGWVQKVRDKGFFIWIDLPKIKTIGMELHNLF